MPFTQFSSLDFDQIKAQIKDFIRSNSNFSGFDFEGSNFSVLIDTLAYNTYINAFNANLIANESFLDSATIRENVVSLARNIGYLPRSKSAATATIRISDINVGTTNDNSTKFSVEVKSCIKRYKSNRDRGTIEILAHYFSACNIMNINI